MTPVPPSVPAAPGVVETHSAWVVFLGDRAYKVKKPVDLGFLDFSTPERRARALQRELELNRRLAPDVYLGVRAILGPDGLPCEHLLVMQRMPEERRLAALVERGVDVEAEVRAVARLLAEFHVRAETSREIAAAGAPATLRAKVATDLAEMETFTPELLDADAVAAARRLAFRFLAGRTSLLDARRASGFVRDGHGDLLADDIFCLPDGPRVLDCIEFDDQLRYCDVLADVAFLAMDLERLGAKELSARFLEWYAEFSGEHHPRSLADYYVATRALVRAKVACIRARQGDPLAAAAARDLLALATTHLRAAQVCLVLVGGPPGTGKSTLARGLADRRGWVVLRSDEVRKDVTGVGRARGASSEVRAGIYSPAVTASTYTALLARAGVALHAGESVVLDATWADESRRAAAEQVARDTSATFVQLCCDVAPDVAAARIAARRRAAIDVSDADEAVAAALRSSFDPWPGAHVVSTLGDPAAVTDAAQRVIDGAIG